MPNEIQIHNITTGDGEIVSVSNMDSFRAMAMPEQAATLVTVKKCADYFRKLYNEMEPLLRTKMDLAREDSTQINQVALDGYKVHLGAGKEDSTLSQSQIEAFHDQMQLIDQVAAQDIFEMVHKVKKAEVTKYRKRRGEVGSMERKRVELIDQTYNPQPKRLEVKES